MAPAERARLRYALATGDDGELDASGRLRLLGRRDRLIPLIGLVQRLRRLGLICRRLRLGHRAFPLAHDRGLLRSGLISPDSSHAATLKRRLTACQNACCGTAVGVAA